MSINLLIECQYLPCIEYFALIYKFDEIYLDSAEFYIKQTYRNRCRIRGANKIETLIVPVRHTQRKIPMKDVEIDYDQKWLPVHSRTIQSAYGKAPFYEYFANDLYQILNRKYKYLFDLNFELLTKCLDFLKINKTILIEDYFNKTVNVDFNDVRGHIHPKRRTRNNLCFEAFPYWQVFGKDFDNNLSIIDLIFCEGPNAMDVLTKSKWIK